jgi:hypothetical protein
MDWTGVLVAGLTTNALVGFTYRLYRYARGGPLGDVVGQAILGVLLGGLALAVAAGASWARWLALAYGLLFGLVVMPLWVLAVLIPLPPGPVDRAFTALYWLVLGSIVVAALAA